MSLKRWRDAFGVALFMTALWALCDVTAPWRDGLRDGTHYLTVLCAAWGGAWIAFEWTADLRAANRTR